MDKPRRSAALRAHSGPSPPAATRPSSSRSAAGCAATARGGVDVLDGYADGRALPRLAPGRCWRRGPTGSATAATRSAARRYQLPLTEPARHNAIHGLVNWVPLAAGRAGAGRGDASSYDLPPQPGYPWPLRLRTPVERRRRTGCAPSTRRPTPAAEPAPVRLLACTRTCSCPASPVDDLMLRRAGAQPAAGRRPAAADRRGPGGRHRVRLHRARAGSATPMLDTALRRRRSATPTAAPR